MKLYNLIQEIITEAWESGITQKFVLLFNNKKKERRKEIASNVLDIKVLREVYAKAFIKEVFKHLDLPPVVSIDTTVEAKPNFVFIVNFNAKHEGGATSTGKITFDNLDVVYVATDIKYNDGKDHIIMDPNTPDSKLYKKSVVKKKEAEPSIEKPSKPEKNVWDIPDAKKKSMADKNKEKKASDKIEKEKIQKKKDVAKKEKAQLPAEYQKYVKGQSSWALWALQSGIAKIEDTPDNIVKIFIKKVAQFIGYDMKKDVIATGVGRDWNVKYGDLSADITLGPLGQFDMRNVVVKFDDYVIYKYKEAF